MTVDPAPNPKLGQIDIAEPLPVVHRAPASCVVRMWGRPLGFIDVRAPSGPDALAQRIWSTFGAGIQRGLIDGGLAPLSTPFGGAGLPSDSTPTWLDARRRAERYGPPVTVVVCTRNRPQMLARSLASLSAVTYHDLEIIVVDNAPTDDATFRCVATLSDTSPHPIRYLAEHRPGLSWARNAGLAACGRPVVAFTDDDVAVDRWWVSELVRAFDIAPNVGCVTGQILPDDLDSDVSRWRESYAGAMKYGFERRVFDRVSGGTSSLYPFTTGECGNGMNMAFRTDILRDVGAFETALGVGTRTGGGEDLAIFYEILAAGWRLVFEPSALVSHSHRTTVGELELQMANWGSGLTAHLTNTVVRHPAAIFSVAARVLPDIPAALRFFSPRARGRPRDYPHDVARAEYLAMPKGPLNYFRARRDSARLARGLIPLRPTGEVLEAQPGSFVSLTPPRL